MLEKVQRRATKMVEGFEPLEGYCYYYYYYSDRPRILGRITLEAWFLRADLFEVFKILRGFENVDHEMMKSSFRLRETMVEECIASGCLKGQIGCWAVQVCESGV